MLTLIRKLQCYLSLIIKGGKRQDFTISHMFYYMCNENNKLRGVIFKSLKCASLHFKISQTLGNTKM